MLCIGLPVEKVGTWDPDLCEPYGAIVDPIQTNLVVMIRAGRGESKDISQGWGMVRGER